MRGLFAAMSALYVGPYRATGGALGRSFRGGEVGLVTHRGARSGRERVTPLMVQRSGRGFVLIASNGGRPKHPAWYHNLRVHPEVALELGRERARLRARVATGAERDELWERTKAVMPFFAEYERATTRRIPVVVLDPA